MEAHARMRLGREVPVNCFLLCTVLAKQTRRLSRLMPDRGIPELITIALKNCADYELALDIDPEVPAVVREEAMQIGRLARCSEPPVAASLGRSEGSWFADVVSAAAQAAGQREAPREASRLRETAMGAHVSVSSSVDSAGFHGDLSSVQRKRSMSNPNGMDPARVRQLRAIAENLCALANRHRENRNYVVAHALFGRALSVAQEVPTPEHDNNSLVTRIRREQQAVFEMLRSGKTGPDKPPQEKAKQVGR